VWNGDNYDARFLDPKPGEPGNTLNKGMIIGLTNKDRTGPTDTAAKRHRGFFLEYDRARDGDTLIIKDQSALKETVARPVKLQFSRKQTETPAFKRWFGNSKVVDADGQPLVVYHGSRTAEPFEVFETPSYFTDRPEFAGDFGTDNTYRVYLRIQNPYEIDGEEEGRHFEWDEDDVADMVSDGYDGVIVKHPDGDVYTVFEPTQIKSATGNRGTFDPENASILFSRKQGDVLARDPRLEQAAQGMKEGTVTSAEYRELVNAIKPVTP
jgi:hypothetical protein